MELSHLRKRVQEEEDQEREQWTPNSARNRARQEAERARQKTRRLIGTVVTLAACAGLAALAYSPQVRPLIMNAAQMAMGRVQPAPTAPEQAPEEPAPPPTNFVVVDRAVNVRTAPSAQAEVVVMLQHGAQIIPGEQSGNWTHIQFKRDNSAELQKGWVYTTLLKPAAPAEKPAAPAAGPAAPAEKSAAPAESPSGPSGPQ
jgi:hypothetical protein